MIIILTQECVWSTIAGGAFLATKSGPGDHFWAEPIFAFHDVVILMYAHAGVKKPSYFRSVHIF